MTARASGDGWICEVTIEEPRGNSEHTVEVSRAEFEQYASGRSVEELVAASFDFLLEREPPGAILRRFRLRQIQDYFPEFGSQI